MKRIVEKSISSLYKELKDTAMLNVISDRVADGVVSSVAPKVSKDGVEFNVQNEFGSYKTLKFRKLDNYRDEDYELYNPKCRPEICADFSVFLEDEDKKVVERMLWAFKFEDGLYYKLDTMKYTDNGYISLARIITGACSYYHILTDRQNIRLEKVEDIIDIREQMINAKNLIYVYDLDILIKMIWELKNYRPSSYGQIEYSSMSGLEEFNYPELNKKLRNRNLHSPYSIWNYMTTQENDIAPYEKHIGKR